MQGSRAAQAFEAAARHAEADKQAEITALRRQIEAEKVQELTNTRQRLGQNTMAKVAMEAIIRRRPRRNGVREQG